MKGRPTKDVARDQVRDALVRLRRYARKCLSSDCYEPDSNILEGSEGLSSALGVHGLRLVTGVIWEKGKPRFRTSPHFDLVRKTGVAARRRERRALATGRRAHGAAIAESSATKSRTVVCNCHRRPSTAFHRGTRRGRTIRGARVRRHSSSELLLTKC